MMSSCQSVGSFYHSSQRVPKVSIGIMVENTPKIGTTDRKEEEAVFTVEKAVPQYHKKVEEKDSGFGTTKAFAEKQVLGKGKLTSWVSTRSMHHETSSAKTDQFHTKASVLQLDGGLVEKLENVPYERGGDMNGKPEKIGDIAFATIQETQTLPHVTAEAASKFIEGRSETLRMKLWEVLGDASQSRQVLSPVPVNEITKNSKCENYEDRQMNALPKPKQDTDTIESYSENRKKAVEKASPKHTKKRTFIRSSVQKKEQGRTRSKCQLGKNNARKLLSSSRPEPKEKSEHKNIFTFDDCERRIEGSDFAANCCLPASAQKKINAKGSRVEMRKTSFPRRSNSRKSLHSDKSLQTTDRKQIRPPPENEENRSTALENRIIHREVKENSSRQPNSSSVKFAHLSASPHVGNVSNSSLMSGSETRKFDSPSPEREPKGSQDRPFSIDRHPLGKVGNQSLTRETKPLDHTVSPILAISTTPPFPKRESLQGASLSPSLSEMNSASSCKSPLTPKACSSRSDSQKQESSDGARDLQPSPNAESQGLKDNTLEKCFSPAQVRRLSGEGLMTEEFVRKGFREAEGWCSRASSPSKSPLPLHRSKRLRSLEETGEAHQPEPLSTPPFDISRSGETISSSHGFRTQSPEDNLGRAIGQLALVLDRFKAKIRSYTSKKGSEILSAAREGVRLRLREVENLIQADAEKLASHGKSKRKRLESTFLEQQEKLKLVYDRFREEVERHLVDCRCSLEDLEAYEEELKGNVDRQKSVHRKLILQLEEVMEAQLAEAEASVAAIQKAARKRMNGLKGALREWLTDDGASD